MQLPQQPQQPPQQMQMPGGPPQPMMGPGGPPGHQGPPVGAVPVLPPNSTTPPTHPPKPPTPSTETSSNSLKQLEKLERDEPLGDQATIAMILYANQNHPGLKAQYPDWKDRFKQINKIWKQLANDKRQPYVQQARENRTASRMNKQVCIGIILLFLTWVINTQCGNFENFLPRRFSVKSISRKI